MATSPAALNRSSPSEYGHALRIVALVVAGAVLYGVLHDQVTTRIAIEYFTIGHPPLVSSDSPTVLALAWGVVATWWLGLALGLCLAGTARLGRRPPLTWRALVKPLAITFAVMAATALLAGFVGRFLAESGRVWLLEPVASRVPKDRHVAYLSVLWAHNSAYAAAALGGVLVAIHTWRRRRVSQDAPS